MRPRLPSVVAGVIALLLATAQPASAATLTSLDQFGSSRYDEAWGVAVDANGIAYVAGFTAGTLPGQTSAGGNDAFVRASAPDGTVLWTRQFGTKGDDRAFSISLDGIGGLYVAGVTTGRLPGQTKGGGGFDAFVRKLYTNGDTAWTRQFGTSADDIASETVADASGVAVIGNTAGSLGSRNLGRNDAFVRAFDPDGNVRWTQQFGTKQDDFGFGLALGGDGALYAVGFVKGTLPGERSRGAQDAFVRRYAPDGTTVWTSQFGTKAVDFGFGMAVVGDVVYVSGTTDGSFGGQGRGHDDAFVRAISAVDGSALWTRQTGTQAEDWSTNLAADASGAYAVGWTAGSLGGPNAGRQDVFVWALDPTGATRSIRQFGTRSTDYGDWSVIDGTSLDVVGITGGRFEGSTKLGGGDAYLGRLPITP